VTGEKRFFLTFQLCKRRGKKKKPLERKGLVREKRGRGKNKLVISSLINRKIQCQQGRSGGRRNNGLKRFFKKTGHTFVCKRIKFR